MADQQRGLGERVGNEAHDATDTGNPLKVGGHANAALRSAVGEDDRVDLSCDLAGQARVINDVSTPLFVMGELVHSAVDSGNPIKIGGRALASLGLAVSSGDRHDAIMSQTGGLLMAGNDGSNILNIELNAFGQIEVDLAAQSLADITVSQATAASFNAQVQGNTAHNDADVGNPVKVGGIALSVLSSAVSVGDRHDTIMSLTGGILSSGVDGTNIRNIAVNSSGQLEVDIIGGGGGGTSETDNSVFTGGTTAVTPIGALFDNSPPTITDGRIGAPRMDSERALLMVGNVAHTAVDSGNPIKTGSRARSTLDSAVSLNDRHDDISTLTGGRLIAGVEADDTLQNIRVNAAGRLEVDISSQLLANISVGQATVHTPQPIHRTGLTV